MAKWPSAPPPTPAVRAETVATAMIYERRATPAITADARYISRHGTKTRCQCQQLWAMSLSHTPVCHTERSPSQNAHTLTVLTYRYDLERIKECLADRLHLVFMSKHTHIFWGGDGSSTQGGLRGHRVSWVWLRPLWIHYKCWVVISAASNFSCQWR